MVKIIGPASIFVDITVFTERFARDGETVSAESVFNTVGGKGNNQMTAVRLAGADAFPIEKIGKDLFGGMAENHMDAYKIQKKYFVKTDGVSTGFANMIVDMGKKENKLYIVKGASAFVFGEDVYKAEEDFKDCDVAIAQFENTLSAVEACKELAKKYGKKFILNPAPCLAVEDFFWSGIDFVTPNETEAEFYTGIKVVDVETAREAAKAFISKGVKNVVFTLGSEGAYYTDGREEIFVNGLKVEAVDPTGAGDTFNGYLATAVAEGYSMEKAMRFANCAAAISVTRKGASSSIPIRKEVEAFYLESYGEEF